MSTRERVIEILRDIYDPEIPVSLYDLGLVRELDVDEKARLVKIRMIFTAGRMCPLPDLLTLQIKHRIKRELNYETEVKVDLDARWSPSMATKEGLEALREIFGEEALRSLMTGSKKIRIRMSEIDPIQYMRERVEARYRTFKEWLERTKIT